MKIVLPFFVSKVETWNKKSYWVNSYFTTPQRKETVLWTSLTFFSLTFFQFYFLSSQQNTHTWCIGKKKDYYSKHKYRKSINQFNILTQNKNLWQLIGQMNTFNYVDTLWFDPFISLVYNENFTSKQKNFCYFLFFALIL